jgi:hypothetical protein
MVIAAWLRLPVDTEQPHKENAVDKERSPISDDCPHSPSADFLALIHAIRAEGRRNRREERREDRGKKSREIVTIILLGLTFAAIAWQVHEMIKVYGPIKEQADAEQKSAAAVAATASASVEQIEEMRQSARAWVGPMDASIETAPKVGVALEGIVKYQNSGKTPATGFEINSLDLFTFTKGEDQSGAITARISADTSTCMGYLANQDAGVVYPTTGFSSYNLGFTFDAGKIDQGVVSGEKSLAIDGCFIYVTDGQTHHSSWCYIFQNGRTKLDHLNICRVGNYAD